MVSALFFWHVGGDTRIVGGGFKRAGGRAAMGHLDGEVLLADIGVGFQFGDGALVAHFT